MTKLYESGSLSRESYLNGIGYDLDDQLEQLEYEKRMMEDMDLPEFGAAPYSREPKNMGEDSKNPTESNNSEE